ncbi:MAG: PP0621 family protein [Burkholderiales bacterium]
MKFLLVFLIVLIVAWRWRTWRVAARLEKRTSKVGGVASAEMIPCRHCGLHLPIAEAVVGKLGTYCSNDHRLKVEP